MIKKYFYITKHNDIYTLMLTNYELGIYSWYNYDYSYSYNYLKHKILKRYCFDFKPLPKGETPQTILFKLNDGYNQNT